MKPCACNGTNDNCRYCSGSGYVSDPMPMPKPPTPSQRIPMSFTEKEPLPPVYPKAPTDWKEVIIGVLSLLAPLIIWFLHSLWKNAN